MMKALRNRYTVVFTIIVAQIITFWRAYLPPYGIDLMLPVSVRALF